jgi:hypothetical protein
MATLTSIAAHRVATPPCTLSQNSLTVPYPHPIPTAANLVLKKRFGSILTAALAALAAYPPVPLMPLLAPRDNCMSFWIVLMDRNERPSPTVAPAREENLQRFQAHERRVVQRNERRQQLLAERKKRAASLIA